GALTPSDTSKLIPPLKAYAFEAGDCLHCVQNVLF
ncbi:hypothetical protein SAMN05216249_1411, partial [Acetitomaculum ruminis DSM 5522]